MKSGIDRKSDRWTPSKAYERLRFDLNIFKTLCRFILSLFKEEMPNKEETESICGLKPVAMFATMIKEKFKDDDFLAGTCGFVWGYYRFVFFFSF